MGDQKWKENDNANIPSEHTPAQTGKKRLRCQIVVYPTRLKGQAERNGYARIVFLRLRTDNLVLRGEFVAEASLNHRATV